MRATVNADVIDHERVERFKADRNIAAYLGWRCCRLTLEGLLALVRDDARYYPLDTDGERRHGAHSPDTRATREIEIRLLLRDGAINGTAATALRRNLTAHFKDPKVVALVELPSEIEFDEEGALLAARAACPRRSTLPVERQLALLDEDHAHDLRTGLDAPLFAAVAAFRDRTYKLRAADLRQQLVTGGTTVEASRCVGLCP